MPTKIKLSRIAAESALALAALLLLSGESRASGLCQHQQSADDQKAQTRSPAPWATDAIMPAQKLAQRLSDTRAKQLVILYVGPAALYKRSHIPSAKFIGPMSQPEGPGRLDREAQNIDSGSELVIYCGCCPWDVCPNIRPAFAALRERGFKKISVLHLPETFRQDWVNKRFPVATGASL